jgi:hypothetical protein
MIKEILDAPGHAILWYVRPNTYSLRFGVAKRSSDFLCQVSLRIPAKECYYYQGEEVEVFLTREAAVARFIKVIQDIHSSRQLSEAVDIARENGIDIADVLPDIEKQVAVSERQYLVSQIHKLEAQLDELKGKLAKLAEKKEA